MMRRSEVLPDPDSPVIVLMTALAAPAFADATAKGASYAGWDHAPAEGLLATLLALVEDDDARRALSRALLKLVGPASVIGEGFPLEKFGIVGWRLADQHEQHLAPSGRNRRPPPRAEQRRRQQPVLMQGHGGQGGEAIRVARDHVVTRAPTARDNMWLIGCPTS